MIGTERIVHDLSLIGYVEVEVREAAGIKYAILSGFEIPAGSFAGRVIDLAIPVPNDYPRSVGASIHVKASPHLVPFGNTPGVRNVVESGLGCDWQYWSYCFILSAENPTIELISKINEIFRKN
jgi:hypothetical protein